MEIKAEKELLSPSYLKELKRYVGIFQGYFKETDIRDIGTKKVEDFHLTLNGSPKYPEHYILSPQDVFGCFQLGGYWQNAQIS